jgi:ABC-type transport system involved in multi-copper enzyme maturation permease subunit
LALIRKELASYFAGPLVYIVVGAFLWVTGFQFYTTLNSYIVRVRHGIPDFWRTFVNHVAFYLLIVVPLFTMRQERRLGTIELLYTRLRDGEIVASPPA